MNSAYNRRRRVVTFSIDSGLIALLDVHAARDSQPRSRVIEKLLHIALAQERADGRQRPRRKASK